VQVRDLSVLDEAFHDALDCSSGGQVCTNLIQLGVHTEELATSIDHRSPGQLRDDQDQLLACL
jgi:hypothetical protein